MEDAPQPPRIVDSRALFRPVSSSLVELLRGLSDEKWEWPTVAGKWRVRDIVAHLLDSTLRRLSFHRDGMKPPPPPNAITSEREFVDLINALNAQWVSSAKRLSPRVLTDLYEQAGNDLAPGSSRGRSMRRRCFQCRGRGSRRRRVGSTSVASSLSSGTINSRSGWPWAPTHSPSRAISRPLLMWRCEGCLTRSATCQANPGTRSSSTSAVPGAASGRCRARPDAGPCREGSRHRRRRVSGLMMTQRGSCYSTRCPRRISRRPSTSKVGWNLPPGYGAPDRSSSRRGDDW